MVCSAIYSLQMCILWVFLTYFAKSASQKYILKLKKIKHTAWWFTHKKRKGERKK